jgi:hypothetical protein
VHAFKKFDAVFTISEGINRVNSTSQLGDGVAAVIAVVFTMVVQPDQKDILDHLYVDSWACNCAF